MEESDKEQLLNYILAQTDIINSLIDLIGCTLLDNRIPQDIKQIAESKLKPIAIKHTKLIEQSRIFK